MNPIKVIIEDREYANWHFDSDIENLNPLELKLFNNEIITLDNDNKVTIRDSYIRSKNAIPGVLQLEGNKTFGRTANNKRLFYKCIPNDPCLPIFLVPYEIKMGFLKQQCNKYVLFYFDSWEDKHPLGLLMETIGDVSNIECYYEYELHCKKLNISLSDFNKKTKKIFSDGIDPISKVINDDSYKIQDCRDKYVFSIDPVGSMDIDDTFSIESNGNGWKISIYISNVFLLLDYYDLWDSLSARVATIYLPDRKRTMLPAILSDDLCSLLEKKDRLAFVMEIIVDADGIVIDRPIHFFNAVINVSKNYRYEESNLKKDKNYNQLFDISKKMNMVVTNSHDLVEQWMIMMNNSIGKCLAEKKVGIFRSVEVRNKNMLSELEGGIDNATYNTIRYWNNATGKYCLYKEGDVKHDVMGNNNYIHITSPIRRLVDLLNQITALKTIGIFSKNADSFLDKWSNKMDFLNKNMKSIRKVQSNCELLNKCFYNPEVMDIHHKGFVFNKEVTGDRIRYTVYLEGLKLITSMKTTKDVPNYSYSNFKLFLFEDEDKIKKKIRLEII